MNFTNARQPRPFANVGPQLFAPRDDEDVVPNPFAIPPEWLDAWQQAADAAEAEETERAQAAVSPQPAPTASQDVQKKQDQGVIATLSAAIPKFFSRDTSVSADKKSSGVDDFMKSIGDLPGQFQKSVTDAFGNVTQQLGSTIPQIGQQTGAGAAKGAMDQANAGLPGLIANAQHALEPAVQGIIGSAVQAAKAGVSEMAEVVKPAVGELAHTAGKQAAVGVKSEIPENKSELLGINTTTLAVGSAAVLGTIGLGAWLLSGNRGFGATSVDEFQSMLDRASWTRPAGKPAVEWTTASSRGRKASERSGANVKDQDTGIGAGLAMIGGASALGILAGIYLKRNELSAEKSSSGGAYGTGGSSSPITHRSGWGAARMSSGPAALAQTSSPLHPFSLAASLGMSHELLHLDPTAILGKSPTQSDHDDFFAGYPIGHKAGSDNCDAARLNKTGIVYKKDASKSQSWDNGWMKGYYDGWIAEGCKAGITTASANSSKTSSGPGDATPSGTAWAYLFTYQDGSTSMDPTPIPNAQVSVTDNLVPDTAKASHAIKVERVRFPDNKKVTVWSADKTSSGTYVTAAALTNVLLPWQKTAYQQRRLQYPKFGNDPDEMIRVLGISQQQIQKASGVRDGLYTPPKPFAAADAVSSAFPPGFTPPPGAPMPTLDDVNAAGAGPVSSPDDETF